MIEYTSEEDSETIGLHPSVFREATGVNERLAVLEATLGASPAASNKESITRLEARMIAMMEAWVKTPSGQPKP